MRPGVSWCVLGVSLGVLGCPGVIRPTQQKTNDPQSPEMEISVSLDCRCLN